MANRPIPPPVLLRLTIEEAIELKDTIRTAKIEIIQRVQNNLNTNDEKDELLNRLKVLERLERLLK